MLYPSTLVFTAENYATPQEVVVLGRSDSVQDGDVSYTVNFVLLGVPADPYYAALGDVSYTMVNRAKIEDRLSFGVATVGCGNLTEGATAGTYAGRGADTCDVTVREGGGSCAIS